jgi:hypothetical protein
MIIKKLIFKLSLILFPILIICITILIIDPYNLFALSNIIHDSTKINISYKLHYCLWKAVKFKNKPVQNILLGDSRMNDIDPDQLSVYSNDKYFNFAYGGATLPEIIETFWFATKYCKPHKVYIGINFNNYNANIFRNRFNDVNSIFKNNLLYFTNRIVIKASYFIIYSKITKIKMNIDKPPMGKSDFWHYQLNVAAKSYYNSYRYPKEYFNELKKIADWCNQNNIQLSFIIFPTHIELQNKVMEYGLISEEKRFKSDLAELGNVYDFDYPNGFTIVKDNFKDPFHTLQTDNVISEIWGQQLKYVQIYKKIKEN